MNSLYRQLPQVGEFLTRPEGKELLRHYPRALVIEAVRSVLDGLRRDIGQAILSEPLLDAEIGQLPKRVAEVLRAGQHGALRRVINASGVILQTNLGRAPLSEAAVENIAAVARGYCNLEFDVDAGERGHRGAQVEDLVLRLAECDSVSHSALVVNNCAAATFLALNSVAEGGEVIVSRGELVEIGGGFRVPEILRKSGARLVEVGTTNRTRIDDYAAAVTAETRAILWVHRSNFQITGFTEQPELRELVRLGREAGVPVVVDQGTGCVVALDEYGLGKQSSFIEAVKSGAALVCASGDKLLGGPQCGVVMGAPNLVHKLRKNPLYRAFRVDKLTLAALEPTLRAYLAGQLDEIPIMHMMAMSPEAVRARCERWARELNCGEVRATIVGTNSVVGGGTTPGATLPSFAVALRSESMNADLIAARLRKLEPPVIGRIHEGAVLLDLRTVPEDADDGVVRVLRDAFCKGAADEANAPGAADEA